MGVRVRARARAHGVRAAASAALLPCCPMLASHVHVRAHAGVSPLPLAPFIRSGFDEKPCELTYGGYVHHYCMIKASPILSGLAPVSLRLCSQCGQKWVEDRLKVRHTCVFAHLMVCAWEWTWAWVLGVVV